MWWHRHKAAFVLSSCLRDLQGTFCSVKDPLLHGNFRLRCRFFWTKISITPHVFLHNPYNSPYKNNKTTFHSSLINTQMTKALWMSQVQLNFGFRLGLLLYSFRMKRLKSRMRQILQKLNKTISKDNENLRNKVSIGRTKRLLRSYINDDNVHNANLNLFIYLFLVGSKWHLLWGMRSETGSGNQES